MSNKDAKEIAKKIHEQLRTENGANAGFIEMIINNLKTINRVFKQKERKSMKKFTQEDAKKLKVTIEAKQARMQAAKNTGLYSYEDRNGHLYIDLTEEEMTTKTFDSAKLARTLNISEKDAELLKSKGKTYVFAKTNQGKLLELYHSSLFVNNLRISVHPATEERYQEFLSERNEWEDAPHSSEVEQSNNKNHFVC